MLRGFALAVVLLNLALLLWGSGRPGPERPPASQQMVLPDSDLPTLVLLQESSSDPAELPSVVTPCLLLGPVSGDDADTLVEAAVAWNMTWRRSEEEDGIWVEIEPEEPSNWPEGDIRALADSMGAEIFPCQDVDAIAPGGPRP
ncbi:MAG: hypothetical protein JJT88_01585 [Gammaproteobacteria bacterium]|nr:hypothetical protein [Gammaproteobacteria bacterium]